MPTYIHSIGTSNPSYKIPQEKIAGFVSKALGLNGLQSSKLQKLYKATGISHRYSVIPDYALETAEFEFFPRKESLEPFPRTNQRMKLFREHALPLALEAVKNCLGDTEVSKITHLITVSCTGLYAPGLDVELVEEMGFDTSVQRTCINFMGCYAAFNALKVADHICKADPAAKVLVACVELCSVHFQKQNTNDYLLSSALFGDGAAAVLLSGRLIKGVNLHLRKAYCQLDTGGKKDMAWHISDHGFEMTLSSYIPSLLKHGMVKLTSGLFNNGISRADIDFFAIHPGGIKILQACEEVLGIAAEKNKYAYKILEEFGNMSSATVLFVLKELLQNLSPADEGKKILSLAFGPGLTLESIIFDINYV